MAWTRSLPGVVSRLVAAALMVASVYGCDGINSEGNEEEIVRVERPNPTIAFTTDEILKAAYSSYRMPSGAYSEPYRGDLYYVNTVSVERQNFWRELCAESRDEAFAWSESTMVNSSDYRSLESERQTEKFFEFTRRSSRSALQVRAHKCSYLDEFAFDRMNPQPLRGVFNHRPIDTATVKELVEYMWFVGAEYSGRKVLESEATEASDQILHRFISINTVGGDWGIPDVIYAHEVNFAVDKDDGEVRLVSEIMLERLRVWHRWQLD